MQHECCNHHWFRRAGWVGSRSFFAQRGHGRRRHRQRHAPPVLRRRSVDALEPRPAWSRRWAIAIGTSSSIFATTAAIDSALRALCTAIELVVHAAAQPSHDWAAREPKTDFSVNAVGTLNLLEATGGTAPECRVHLHLDEQGLRRHAEPLPLVELHALGNRSRPHAMPTASART